MKYILVISFFSFVTIFILGFIFCVPKQTLAFILLIPFTAFVGAQVFFFKEFRNWATKRWLARLRKRYYEMDQNLDRLLTEIVAFEKEPCPPAIIAAIVARAKIFYDQGRAHQRALLTKMFEETLLLETDGEALLQWAFERRTVARFEHWENEVRKLDP